MMPEQMAMQAAMMKPMMFTMIFIIAIFSWMATSTESFRVDYVSTPWSATWNFENKVFWIFPAWIATYISMSAPLGRIVDRHIKLVRYKSHPLVTAGKSIPELYCIYWKKAVQIRIIALVINVTRENVPDLGELVIPIILGDYQEIYMLHLQKMGLLVSHAVQIWSTEHQVVNYVVNGDDILAQSNY